MNQAYKQILKNLIGGGNFEVVRLLSHSYCVRRAAVYTSLCIAALFACMLASCKGQTNQTPHTGIYICDSPWAQCYHTDYDCEGLQQCGSVIREVTEAEAQKMGRRPCGYCMK